MPYTQTPGRGNNPKTGPGLPASLNSGSTANTSIDPKKGQVLPSKLSTYSLTNLSKELGDKIEAVSAENKARRAVEGTAKNDSIVASKMRGGNAFQNAIAGNAAANATRSKAKMGDMNVYRGSDTNNMVTYSRDTNVEKNMPTPVLNKSTGQYGFNPFEKLGVKAGGWITTNQVNPR